jgi:hypothetical protein
MKNQKLLLLHLRKASIMKKPIFSLLCLLIVFCSQAQTDTLFFRDGAITTASIVEISTESVKYLKADNMEGPRYVAAISDLSQIVYRNGRREVYASTYAAAANTKPTMNAAATFTSNNRRVTEKGVRFSGPRIGVGYIGAGMYADEIIAKGKQPIVSQFGWQFETRIFTSATGLSGLAEFVPMISGMEQGLFFPSGTFLLGARVKDKFEFAVGPTIAYPSGLGMAFTVGTSFKYEDVYFPVTLAFVPDVTKKTTEVLYNGKTISTIQHSGFRVSLLFGFNIRRG